MLGNFFTSTQFTENFVVVCKLEVANMNNQLWCFDKYLKEKDGEFGAWSSNK